MVISLDSMTVVITHLFKAEHRRLKQYICRIIDLNNEARSTATQAITYEGRIYTKDKNQFLGPIEIPQRPLLDQSVIPEMIKFLADEKQIKSDEAKIRQLVGAAICHCETLQEVRDLLPDCMVQYIESLKGVSRQNPIGSPILAFERAHRQYMAIVPKIEMYSVTHLMY